MSSIAVPQPASLAATQTPAPQESRTNGLLALLSPEETWLAFGLIAMLFLTTVWAVEGAKWVQEMPGLTGMALGALLTGYVLARLRVPAVLLQPVGIVVGLLVVGWQTVSAASGSRAEEKIIDAVVRLYSFVEVVRMGGISTDGLPFAVQVLLLTWCVGYFSAWFLYRSHSVWLAIVPAGTALMVNLTYLPGRFVPNFFLFVIASLLLVMLMHGVEQRRRWRRANVPLSEMARLSYVEPVLGFGSALLVIAFWMPLLEQSTPVTLAWEQITGPWRTMEREFDRLFASVSSGRVAPLHSFGRAMPFRGAVNFGDQLPLVGRLGLARDVVVYVQADEPGYWRAESYDTYTGQGWISTERVTKAFAQDPVPGAIDEYKNRRAFNQSVEVVAPMDVLVARGMPIYGSIQAKGEMGQPATFTLHLNDLPRNRTLRPELQALATELSRSLKNIARLPEPGQFQRLLPSDLRVRPGSFVRSGTEIESIEVTRTEPFPPDLTSVRAFANVPRGQKYTIASSVSTASAEALQAAGTNYPGWVRDQYLQVPASLPDRVRRLAEEWTQEAKTPSDKAAAIEAKLREVPYSTSITPPPRGGDGIDHFLFTLKRGYADYHSSAMAVMLRALGIPARVTVGYVSGEWDTEQERYVIREAHAHAWTEVFFPGYGWIEFNPTPNWPTVPRTSLSGGSIDPEEDPANAEIPPSDEELFPGGVGGPLGENQWFVPVEVFKAVLVGSGILGILWLALRFLWLYGLSKLNLPGQTYEKMCRLAYLAGLGLKVEQTPSEYAQALAMAVPSAQGSIYQITQSYTKVAYGQQEPAPAEARRLQEAWRALRWKLVLKVLRWRDDRKEQLP